MAKLAGNRDGTRCPHTDVRYCPLYVATHAAGGLGCDDGEMGHGGCAVDRGMSYQRQVELIRVKCPALVEQLEWNEATERGRQQRARNLKGNGIH